MEEQRLSNNSTPLVSIILPVYNAGKYLRPCLDTLVNQTLRDIEIICVLDCPTDGSDKVVEEYAEKDNRIVVIKNDVNLNICKSRNLGIRAARGEYIGFSDHDDTHELNMYERLYLATEGGAKSAVFSGTIVEELKEPLYKSTPDYQQLFYILLAGKHKHITSGHITPNLYQRQFILTHSIYFPDSSSCYAEDLLFNLSFISNIKQNNSIAFDNQKLYNFIIHHNNTHLSPEYTNVEHTFTFLNYLIGIVSNIHDTDRKAQIHELASFRIVSMLYRNLKALTKQYGFFKATKKLQNEIRQNISLKNTILSIPLDTKGLTPPKKILLFWLQWKYR